MGRGGPEARQRIEEERQLQHDVIIVGGSYAGLAAALQLGRARKKVLVIDAGSRRNRTARNAHGLLGHDGRPPDEIAADARKQVLAYPTVEIMEARAEKTERVDGGFTVTDDRGRRHEGKRLILAEGVVDALPDLPGVEELWGVGVFHCPYCHAYELEGRLAVLADGESAFTHAMMVSDWGETTLFTNDTFEPDEEQRQTLARRAIRLDRARVVSVRAAEPDGVELALADGRRERFAGLFIHTWAKDPSPLARMLGCEFAEGPFGAYVKTEENKATTVPGVYACGDAAREGGNLSTAVADGALAGCAAHHSLVFDEPC